MASKNLYFEYDSVYLKYSNGNRCKFREWYIFWHLAFSLNHISFKDFAYFNINLKRSLYFYTKPVYRHT